MKIKENYCKKELLEKEGFEFTNSTCMSKMLFSNDVGIISLLVYMKTRELVIYASNDQSYDDFHGRDIYSLFDEVAPVDAIIDLYKKGIIEQ